MYKHLYLEHKTYYLNLKKIQEKWITEQIGSGQLTAAEKEIINMYDEIQKVAKKREDTFPMISSQY